MTDNWLDRIEELVGDIRHHITEELTFKGEFADAYEGRKSKRKPPEGNLGWAYVNYGWSLYRAGLRGRFVPTLKRPRPEAFIAGSFLVRDEAKMLTRQIGGEDFSVTLVRQVGKQQKLRLHDAGSRRPADSGSAREIAFPPTISDRTHDSECLIVNAIASRIARGLTVERILLHTELPPCPSCRSVIGAFMTKHSHIRMELRYETWALDSDKQAIMKLASAFAQNRLTFTSLADVESELRIGGP